MATVNEQILDATIDHAVDLQQYSNGVVRRVIGVLNKVDSDLFARLTEALSRLDPQSFSVQRLDALLDSARALNLQAYRQVEKALTDELREFALYESQYQLQLFESTVPIQVRAYVAIAPVSVQQVYSAALAQPFRGRLLAEWAKSVEADRMVRIRDAIRIGYVEGQTVDEIVRRLRGTRAKGYSDGIIEIDRRNAESVVRTALSHTAGVTRDRFYEANTDLIKALEWVSTLDSRTTPECRVRDGLQYEPVTHKPVGHKVPWLSGPGRIHWGCRSTSVPVTKSWRELGIDIDEMDESTRASMDGQVPAQVSYGDWLTRQSARRQDQILGATRGRLLREGGVKPDRFYNERGRYLTLDELHEKDAAAFRRAGL